MDVVALIEKNHEKKAKIDFQSMQAGDVKETFADIDKSVEILGYKPTTNVDIGIKFFVNWYNLYINGEEKNVKR